MWDLLGLVVGAEEGGRVATGHKPAEKLVLCERAGFLWLRPRPWGYVVEITPEGSREAHRWASRKAKLAAVEFSR